MVTRADARRRRSFVIALLLTATLTATGCGAATVPASHRSGAEVGSFAAGPETNGPPVSIPLFPRLDADPRLLIDVEIGGAAHRVVLDTGSVGLRLLAGRSPAGAVVPEGPAPPVVFGSDRVATGQIAHTSVGVGGVATTHPIAVELVTDVACLPTRPRCGGAHGGPTIGAGTDGVLGIGMQPGGVLTDPLAALPGGATAVVHFDPRGQSSLQIGVPAAGFTLARLSSGPPAPDGTPTWRVAVRACFAAATLPGGRVCGPTLFDTGTPAVVIHAPGGPPGRVPTGSTLTVGLADGRWSANLSGPAAAALVVPTGRIAPRDVAGLPVFAGTDIRYDLAGGTIGFRSQ